VLPLFGYWDNTSDYYYKSNDDDPSGIPVKAPTDRRPRVDAEACRSADAALVRAFELLGKRWTGVVLGTLSGGPTGFRALARAVEGISDSMLSDRLGALTEAGLVIRKVDEGPPVSVAYELTYAGRALLPALEQITRWAEEHLLVADQTPKLSRPGHPAA
jgi:DNA-binding HxlR family transcriptional regulator